MIAKPAAFFQIQINNTQSLLHHSSTSNYIAIPNMTGGGGGGGGVRRSNKRRMGDITKAESDEFRDAKQRKVADSSPFSSSNHQHHQSNKRRRGDITKLDSDVCRNEKLRNVVGHDAIVFEKDGVMVCRKLTSRLSLPELMHICPSKHHFIRNYDVGCFKRRHLSGALLCCNGMTHAMIEAIGMESYVTPVLPHRTMKPQELTLLREDDGFFVQQLTGSKVGCKSPINVHPLLSSYHHITMSIEGPDQITNPFALLEHGRSTSKPICYSNKCKERKN